MSAASSSPSSDPAAVTTTPPPHRYKIYETEGFPYPTRIRVALAEKNLTHLIEFVPLQLAGRAEHREAKHTARNPTGTVPVLELEDGTMLSEVMAITEWIDAYDGKPSALTGRNARERGLTAMWQRRAEAMVMDCIAQYFHHATPGLGPENQKHKLPQWPARGEWGLINRDRAWAGMRFMDERLQQSPFLAGDEFSAADIALLGGLHFARIAGVGVPPECTTLIAWNKKNYAIKYPPHNPWEPPADHVLVAPTEPLYPAPLPLAK